MEDRELKVMESRVKAAMDKCPAGREILNELFYPEPNKQWEDITSYCSIVTSDFIVSPKQAIFRMDRDYLQLRSNGFTAVVVYKNITPTIYEEFKLEDGRLWKKVGA